MSATKRGRGFAALVVGLFLGAGLLAVFGFAAGATDQRPFCAECHVMMPAAVTHQRSTHTNLNCNDCHLPKSIVYRYPYKAYIGLYDIMAEKIMDVSLPIRATDLMRDIINKNCKSCHAATNMEVASMGSKRYCTECHRNVPHQRTMPISTRIVAYE